MYHRGDLRQTYLCASAVIAVSTFLKAAIQKFMGTQLPVHVVGNPVDLSRFPTRSHVGTGELFRILSIGSLEPRKNYGLLLRAIAIVAATRHVELVIIGTGPEYSRLQSLARQLNIDSLVKFAGHVSDAEIVAYLGRSDLFISSSIKENFGVVIVEAMAHGIPVIATPSGGPEEYISHEAGKLLSDHHPESLASAILDIIHNYSRYQPDRIREIAAQFSFEAIGPQISEIYSQILD
jgi:glycosyltransferase involved in cell wall biosynthesis